jgi:ArsR family transcriptional regulator
MKLKKYEIFEIHANFCRTLANPKRLMIIKSLKKKERPVGEFSRLLQLPISNISQHLKALRDQDIVTSRKVGQSVFYKLRDQRLVDACDLIRKIIVDLYKEKGKIIRLDYDEIENI